MVSERDEIGSAAPDPGRADVGMREYSTQRVVQAVGARWEPPAAGDWLLMVLSPSFHADLVITVHRSRGRSRIDLHTAQCNLWQLYLYTLPPDDPNHVSNQGDTLRPQPDRAWAAAEVETDRADELWRRASAVLGMPPEPDRSWVTLDGMPVTVRLRLGQEFRELEDHPGEEGPIRLLVQAALDLAGSAGDQRIATVAERARAYL
jgi:hypothetical protein